MRLNAGADRMSMPSLPVDTFLHAVKQAVLANRRWVSFLPMVQPLSVLQSISDIQEW
jgi:branched-subunit amino acid aminotransferase/4-amino-4-deoxychorismate lyase